VSIQLQELDFIISRDESVHKYKSNAHPLQIRWCLQV